jgi:hypothetical protein
LSRLSRARKEETGPKARSEKDGKGRKDKVDEPVSEEGFEGSKVEVCEERYCNDSLA